jgi:hypothetical protein
MGDEFSLFKLSLPARLALAAGCFAVGASVQVLLGLGMAPGILVIVVGYLPLFLKRITNKPADIGLEEWRAVSMAEIDRLSDSLRESRKAKNRTIGGTALLTIVAAALAGASGLAWFFSPDLSLALFDGFLFSIPALFFGRARFFVPPVLEMKMPCFQAVFRQAAESGLVVTPYLRFDKDKEGRDIPEDIRLMVEPKRKPEDFVGVQMQAAINKGPNGNVPYLYAVALTKGRATSWKKAASISASGYEVEEGSDGEYGTVVIRQETSNGGYRTGPEDCERLFLVVSRFCAALPAV